MYLNLKTNARHIIAILESDISKSYYGNYTIDKNVYILIICMNIFENIYDITAFYSLSKLIPRCKQICIKLYILQHILLICEMLS